MINFMSYVEAAVEKSPDLPAPEARRYHQQWMYFSFLTLSMSRNNLNFLLERTGDSHFKKNVQLIVEKTGLTQALIEYFLQPEVQTFVLTDTYIITMNKGWSNWMLWICYKIVACYFNEA